MSDLRSQMSDPLDDERPWRKNLPKWWDSTPPWARTLRRENPYWHFWSKFDEAAEQPQAQDTSELEDARLEQRSAENGDYEFFAPKGNVKWEQTKKL